MVDLGKENVKNIKLHFYMVFKAIDLHIHTKRTASDNIDVELDIDRLKRYICNNELRAIAITNHNLFDRAQYNEILQALSGLDVVVFPGVEVNLEYGHILVIASQEAVDAFNEQCSKLESLAGTDKDFSLKYEQFEDIFKTRTDYLLIPHYDKKPSLADSTIDKIGDIVAGEVQSPKKFTSMKNEEHWLTPVLFSDIRMTKLSDDEVSPSPKITYLKIHQISIPYLKIALSDRNNVSLTNSGNDEFIVDSVGTKASLGLNVVLGKRSSGKTHLLRSLASAYGDDSTLHIQQFEITQQCSDDNFDKLINNQYQQKKEMYLAPLKEITDVVVDTMSEREISDKIDTYLSGLKEFAENQAMRDEYSRARLYSEDEYGCIEDMIGNKFLASLKYVIDNAKYSVDAETNMNILKQIFLGTLDTYKRKTIEKIMKDTADTIIISVKGHLAEKSSLKPIPAIDFNTIAESVVACKRYDLIVKSLKVSSTIPQLCEKYGKFNIVAHKSPFNSSKELLEYMSIRTKIKECFDSYYDKAPHVFVKSIKQDANIKEDAYKMILKLEIEPRKADGHRISGGEKAEYVLLKKLHDASTYQLLLFDEPEPSFDNPFINEYVIDELKRISEHTTVFVSTHNNTLGLSMGPDEILYTSEEDDGGHCIYTASLTSGELSTADGSRKLDLRETLLNTLEAGEDRYNERKNIYGNLKN